MSERGLDITVRREEIVYAGNPPKVIERRRRVAAKFERGGVPDWALPIAERTFKMNGKPTHFENGAPYPATLFLWTYDSELDQGSRGWTAEERAAIEAKLRSERAKVVEITPQLSVPWPNYDKLVVHGRRTIDKVVEQILAGIETTGVEPADVLEYERAKLNRAEVIAAVEGLGVEPKDEEPLIAA
jgi:hypothetical protein